MQTWSRPYPITMRTILWYNGSIISDTGDVVQTNGWAFTAATRSAPQTGKFEKGVYKVTGMSALSSYQAKPVDGYFRGIYRAGAYTREWICKGPFSACVSMYSGYPGITYTDFLSQGDVALSAAFAKLGRPKYELGVELGELKETLQFLRNPLSSLRDFLLKDRQRNLRILKQVIAGRRTPDRMLKLTGKTVSDTWLEMRYALRPLISSIQSAVKLNLKTKHDPLRIRTLGKKLTADLTRTSIGLSGTRDDLQVTCKLQTSTKALIRAKVYYRQTSDTSLARKLGVSIVNIPEIAWELTRCSFIVDWFANLGDYIASWRITPEVQILGSTVSYRLTHEHTSTPEKWEKSNVTAADQVNLGGVTSATTQSYDRIVKGTTPPGLPHFRSRPSLDIPKMVDLLLIILQGINLRK